MAPAAAPTSPLARLTAIVTFVVVTGMLYFGRDVLIPFALSVLLAFLLAPAVRRAEHLGLNRPVATTIVASLALAVVVGILWLTATQLVSLASSLPQYRENIRSKVGALRASSDTGIGKAVSTIREIGAEMSGKDEAGKDADGKAGAGKSAAGRDAAVRSADRGRAAAGSRLERVDGPVPVTIEERPLGPIELLRAYTSPLAGPLATGAAVIIFTFVMMLRREDLRDRLIRLVGHTDLNRTTQAMEEAGDRVSRYLRMQLVVNVTYGLPVGIALYVLGVPNAALWAMLAAVLRFVPYVGPWIAAAFPITLAFAISDGWSLVLWTVGVFVALELISNNLVEPWLYGSSTGLSVLAILVAAVFWTWLWGVAGLLLSTPLTVCLFVVGRYVPGLSFLDVMLGDEPVLSPLDRFYQRLLAMDTEEATDLAEDFMTEHGQHALYAELLVPALQLAERDRHLHLLTEERTRSILDTTRRLVETLGDSQSGGVSGNLLTGGDADAGPPICVLSARDEADEIVATMLVHTLHMAGMRTELLGAALLKSEVVERATELAPQRLCVSALPPGAVLQAGAICRRLRARLPEARIVVALWHAQGDMERATQRLLAAGASKVVTTIDAAVNELASAASAEQSDAAAPGGTPAPSGTAHASGQASSSGAGAAPIEGGGLPKAERRA